MEGSSNFNSAVSLSLHWNRFLPSVEAVIETDIPSSGSVQIQPSGLVQSTQTVLLCPGQRMPVSFSGQGPVQGRIFPGSVAGVILTHDIHVAVSGDLPRDEGQYLIAVGNIPWQHQM